MPCPNGKENPRHDPRGIAPINLCEERLSFTHKRSPEFRLLRFRHNNDSSAITIVERILQRLDGRRNHEVIPTQQNELIGQSLHDRV